MVHLTDRYPSDRRKERGVYLDLQLKKKQMKEIAKARGLIYGLAIGDALGWPTEFLKLGQIRARYGPEGTTELPDPALFTDDTQMSIAVARALILAGEKEIDGIMAALQDEFVQWLHSPRQQSCAGQCMPSGRGQP